MERNIFLISYLFGAFFVLASGHSYFSAITIDGVSKPEGECIRPHPSSQYDYPISSLDRPTGLTSADMTCGWLPAASRAANKKCAVNPGSQVTLQWHYEMGMGTSDTFIIDPSHKGPCIVYMAKSETGSGNVWFKIFEDGYDTTTKKWCVDKLRANLGKFTVTIPTDITPGNYLFRTELITLHEGFELTGAQPYVGCAELTVGGSGTINPAGVAIPGVYSKTDPGIFFDIYTGRNPPYPIPGPALYKSGSAQAAVTTKAASVTTRAASVTTGRAASVTTGRVASVTTKAVASPVTTKAVASPVTTKAVASPVTTKALSVTTGTPSGTGNSGTTDSSMCYLPGTPNLNGKINSNPMTCGKKSKKARCADGQCCSQYGYCGPVMDSDGKYYEEMNGRTQVVSETLAFAMYCNKTAGDYRKVPCSSIANLENAEMASSAASLQNTLWASLGFVCLGLFLTN